MQAFLDRGEDFVVAPHPARAGRRDEPDHRRDAGARPRRRSSGRSSPATARSRNPFTKDLQITAIRGARNYLGDKLIRVAAAAPAARPGGRPADRRPAATCSPARPSAGWRPTCPAGCCGPGGEVVPGPVRGRRGRPASAAAACTATASLEGTFLGGCLFSGRTAGRARWRRRCERRAGESLGRPGDARPQPRQPRTRGRRPPRALRRTPPYGYPPPVRLPAAAGTAIPGPWGPVPPRRPAAARAGHHQRRAGVRAGRRSCSSPRSTCGSSPRSIDVAARGQPGRLRARPGWSAGHRGHRAGRRPAGLGRPAGRRRASARSARGPARPGCSLVGAHAVQIVLAVYWAVRLVTLVERRSRAPTSTGRWPRSRSFFAAAPRRRARPGAGRAPAGAGSRARTAP